MRMAALTHKLWIRTSHWRQKPSASLLASIVQQINERAQNRRMIGQIHGAGDGRIRIMNASHVVLPTARVRGSSILVDVEVLESNSPGRTVAAFIGSGLPIQGVIRGVTEGVKSVRVLGIDIDLLAPKHEETVLDDIVDALELAED